MVSNISDIVSILKRVAFNCGLRNTEGGSRSILTVKLRRGRGVCGWPVNTGDEVAEGVSGLGGAGEAKDESLGVECRCLTAAAKILMSFLKAVLSSAQYCGQAENSLGSDLPRRLPKSIAKLVKAVSKAGSARRRKAGVSLMEVMYSIAAKSSLGIRDAC